MAMTSKTMEFKGSVYKFDFGTGLLTVQLRNAHGDLSEPLEFNKEHIEELKEALAGIGQQAPLDSLFGGHKR